MRIVSARSFSESGTDKAVFLADQIPDCICRMVYSDHRNAAGQCFKRSDTKSFPGGGIYKHFCRFHPGNYFIVINLKSPENDPVFQREFVYDFCDSILFRAFADD